MAGFLEGDIKVPGTQGKVPKWAAAVGLGVVGVLIWRARTKSAAAKPASTGTDQYPPDGTTGNPNDPYSTDPATGQTYGDEATAGNLAATGGVSGLGTAGDAFPWDGTYNNPNDPYSMDTSTGTTYGNEGTLIGSGSGGNTGGQGGPPFSTNAQWSQYVLQYFSTNSYDNIGGRTDAIGRYLAGLSVNQQQETWINDATAIGGRPPVAGSGGFPPSIRVAGHKTGGKTYADNPVKGLRVRVTDRAQPGLPPIPARAAISWDSSPHAATYRVTVTEGKRTIHQSETSGHSTTVAGLKHGTEYEVKVLARPARPSAREADTRFRA